MNEGARRFIELVRTPARSARAAYDAAASEYDYYERAWRAVAGDRAVRRVEAVLVERLSTNALVLDAGIGTGAISSRILALNRGARIVGLDLSLEMLRVARRSLDSSAVRVVEGDMRLLPFRGEMFDAVVSTWALETLPDPRQGASELLRVLRPDGFVVCAFSSAATDLFGAIEERLLRKPISEFAGRFLTDEERPMHWCQRSSLERFDHGLTTVVVLGKCCVMEEYGSCLPIIGQDEKLYSDSDKEGTPVAIDPVCGMKVEEEKAAATSEYRGETVYFCAPGCKRAFDQDPDRHMESGRQDASPAG